MAEDKWGPKILDTVIDPDQESRDEAKRDENAWRPRLSDIEIKAQEEGSLQFSSGVVRVSDAPSYEEPLGTSNVLKGDEFGISRGETLRSMVGLSGDERFTDYYSRQGFIPEGFELDAKMLMRRERIKEEESRWLRGEIGYNDFLFEAYGRELMKAEGHDLGSSLYWYNRRRQGMYDNPIDNIEFLANLLEQAEVMYHNERYHEESWTKTFDESLLSVVTGQKLDGQTFRELFPEYMEAMDGVIDSADEMIKLYQAGVLEGFDPVLDTNGDGLIDKYMHTDGILYDVVSAGEQTGNHQAVAHYNSDGSLNRIVVPGFLGEYADSFIKGFTNILLAGVQLIGYAGALIGDLGQGLTGQGWNTNTVRDFYLWSEGWKAEQGWLQNRVYSTTSGFRDQSGAIDYNAIGRGVASGTGTILGMLATAKIGGVLGAKGKALTYGAKKAGIKTLAAKQKAAGTKMAKRSVKRSFSEFAAVGVKHKTATITGYGLKTVGASMSSLTGLTNGMPIIPKFALTNTQATIQGLSFLALRDFTSSVGALSAREHFHDLSDGDIIARAAAMSALNFGVSYYTRSIMDKAAFSRLAERKVGKLARQNQLSSRVIMEKVRAGEISAPFVRMVDSAVRHHPRKFMMSSAALDVMENLFTMATHTSLVQSGKIWDAEAVKTMWNPQTLATQIYIGMVTYKGGLGRMQEGLETGGQLYNIRQLRTLETQYKQWINDQIAKNPDQRQMWEAVRNDFNRIAAQKGNPVKNLTDAFAKAHEGLYRDGSSPVERLVGEYLNTATRQEVLAAADAAIEYYNTIRSATKMMDGDVLTGKFGKWLHYRRRNIKNQVESIIPEQIRKTAEAELIANRDHIWMSQRAEELLPGGTETQLERMIAEKRLEILSMNTDFEIDENWDGTGPRWKATSAFDSLNKEQQSALLEKAREFGLSREMIEDGMIIRINGQGSDFEGTDDYQDLIRAIRFFANIADSETREIDGVKMIYGLDGEKHSTYFIPYYNNALNLSFVGHLGFGLRAVMALRHAATPTELKNALEGLTRVVSGYDDDAEVDSGAMLSMLARLVGDVGKDNGILTLEQAVRAIDSSMLEAFKNGVYAYESEEASVALVRLMTYHSTRNQVLELAKAIQDKVYETPKGKTKMRNLIAEVSKVDPHIREEVFKALGVKPTFLKEVGDALASPKELSLEKLRALSRNPEIIYSDGDVDTELLTRFLVDKLGVTREIDLEEATRAEGYLKRIEKINIPKQAKTILKQLLSSDLSIIDITSDQILELHLKNNAGVVNENILNTVTNQVRRMKGELVLKAFVQSADHVIRSTNPDTPKGQGYLRALNFYADRFIDLLKTNTDLRDIMIQGLGREVSDEDIRRMIIHPDDFESIQITENNRSIELTMREFVMRSVLDRDANLRDAVPSERISLDTINRALADVINLEHGTTEVKGSGILYINLNEVEGMMHRKLVNVAARQPDKINDARDKDTLHAQIKVLFPGQSPEYVMRALANEQQTLARLRAQNPDGVLTIEVDSKNPSSIARVSNLLKQLGYDYFDLDDSLLNTVPGMYLKQGTDLAMPLNFKDAQQKQMFLDTLQAKMQTEFIEQAKQNVKNVDYTKAVEELFGGLYYLDSDTELNIKDFVYTDLASVDQADTGLFRAIQNITGVEYKGGKLAGLIVSLLQESYAGVGVTGDRDPNLYRAQFILDVIDKLDIYEQKVDSADKYAVYQNLSPEEVREFTTNKHLKRMYKLSEAKKTETGTEYRIDIQSDFKRNALRYVRESFENNGQLEMKYILPLGYYRDVQNRTLYGEKEYGANVLGITPGAHVRYNLNRYYSEDTFSSLLLEPIKMEGSFLSLSERERALSKLQGKTVGEILNNTVGLTETELNSMEVRMLIRILEGGQSISRAVQSRAMTQAFDTGFFKRIGDPHVRKIIAVGLQRGASDAEIIQEIKNFKPQNFDQTEAGLLSRDLLSDEQGYIDNNMIARLEGHNKYDLPSDDILAQEIQLVRTALEDIYIPSSTEAGIVRDNIYSKLFGMLRSAGSEEANLNMYLSYIYRLSPEEQVQVIQLLKDFADQVMPDDVGRYNKLGITDLEEKMESVRTTSDLYAGTYERGGEQAKGSRLISEDMTNVGQSMELDATIRLGEDMTSLNRVIDYSINRAQKMIDTRTRIKLGDLSQAEGKHQIMMQKIAEALNLKLNVNNFGSATIANLNLNDMVNHTVSSIYRMTNSLLRENFGIDGFKLSPERALELAWEIYIHSSGVDYSREWTKYLIYDTKTQEISTTAQFITDGNGLNNMFYKLYNFLTDNYEADRYVLMTLDKNMMVDNRTGGADRLEFIPLTVKTTDSSGMIRLGTKDKLAEILFINGLSQYDPDIHRDVARDASDWDKVRNVYAWSISRDDIVQNMVKRFEAIEGLDPRLGRALLMTVEDVDVSKAQHKQIDQAIMNTFTMANQFDKDQKRLVNLQQQRLNDILRYYTTWNVLPEDIKLEINRQATQFDMVNDQDLTRFNIRNIGSAYMRGNQQDLEKALNDARLHTLSDNERKKAFNLLTDYLVLNSRDGKALNMLMTGGRLSNVLSRSKELHSITMETVGGNPIRDAEGNVRTHDTFFKDGVYAQDVEAFYRTENGVEESFIFQHAINEYDAVTDYKAHIDNRGTITKASKRHTTFIPVYYRGELIRTEEQIKNHFPEFYKNYYSENSAAKHYLDWVNSNQVIAEADLPGYLSRTIGKFIDPSKPIITFNGEGYDIRRLEASGLVNSDDPLLKNGFDLYARVVKDMPVNFEMDGRKRKLEMYAANILGEHRVDRAHDASVDVDNTFEVAIELFSRVQDVNKISLGELEELKEVGKIILGKDLTDDEVVTLKNGYTPNILKENLTPESVKYVEDYNKLFESSSKQKANLTKLLKQSLEDFEDILFKQELDVQLRKNRDHADRVLGQNREFYEKLAKGHDRILASEMLYVLQKIYNEGRFTTEADIEKLFADEHMLNSLVDIFKDVLGKDRLSEADWIKVLNMEPEIFLSELALIRPELNVSYEEFKDNMPNSSVLRSFTERYVNSDQYRESARLNETNSLAYKSSYKVAPVFNSILSGSGSDFADSILQREFMTPYNRHTPDNAKRERALRQRLYLRNALTEYQKDMLKNPPVKTISVQRMYELIQPATRFNTVKQNGKDVSMRNDTFYMDKEMFKQFFGNVSFEEAKRNAGVPDGGDLFVPVLRHPLTTIGSVHLYRVEMIDSNQGVRVAMSVDTLRALHQGDVDGDHVSILRPSAHMQAFSNEVDPLLKSSFRMLDTILDNQDGSLKMPDNFDLGNYYRFSERFKNSILEDRARILDGTNTYEELYDRNFKKVMAIVKDQAKAEEIMKHTWLQKKDVRLLQGKRDFIYFTNNRFVQDTENAYMKKLFANAQTMNKELFLKFDQLTGESQKEFLKISETLKGKANEIFNYTSITLTDTTMAIIDRNLETVRSRMSSAVMKDKTLRTEIKTNLKAMIDSAEDSSDILRALQHYEREIFASEQFHRATVSAIEKMNALRPESLSEVDRAYDEALLGYADYMASDTDKRSYFEGEFNRANFIHAFDEMEDNLYFSNVDTNKIAEEIMAQRLHEMDTNTTEYHKTLDKIDGHSDYVRSKTMFIIKGMDGVEVAPDAVIRTANMNNIKHVKAYTIKLDAQDYVLKSDLKEGDIIKAGEKLTKNKPSLDVDIKIARINGPDEISFIVQHDVDSRVKGTFAGSSVVKSVGQETIDGKAFLKRFGRNMEDIDMVTSSDSFDPKKFSSILADQMGETRFYDSNHRRITNPDKFDEAAYAIVDAPFVITENTALFQGGFKESFLDEAAVGNNIRSLEGLVLLGDRYINVTQDENGNATISVDTRTVAEAERAWQQYRTPDYASHNAARVYNLARINTLLKYAPISEAQRIQIMEDAVLLKDAGGRGGVALLRSIHQDYYIPNGIKLTDVFEKFNAWEKALFSERVADLFKIDKPSSLRGERAIDIQSKSSHHLDITADPDTLKKPYTAEGVGLDHDSMVRHNGKLVHDHTEGYASMHDFHRMLYDEYNIMKSAGQHAASPISRYDMERGTALGIFNTARGLGGYMGQGFKSISARDASELTDRTDIQAAARTSNKASDHPTTITKSFQNDYAGHRLRNTESRHSRYYMSSTEDHTDDFRKFFGGTHSKNSEGIYEPGSVDPLRTSIHRARQFLAGSLAPTKTALGKAALHGRGEKDVTIPLSPKVVRTDDTGELKITLENKNIHTDIDSWKEELFKEFGSHHYYDNRAKKSEEIREGFNQLAKQHHFDDRTLEATQNLRSLDDYDPYAQDKHLSKATEMYQQEYANKDNPTVTLERAQDIVTKDVFFGREENMNRKYKTNLLESGGIKIETTGDIQLDRLIVAMVKEPKAFEMMLNRYYLELFNTIQERGDVESFNKFAYIESTLQRIADIEEAINRKKMDGQSITDLRNAIDTYQKILIDDLGFKDLNEVTTYVRNYRSDYGLVIRQYEQLNDILSKYSKMYSHLTDQAFDDVWGLIPANESRNTTKETKSQRAYYRTKMFGLNRPMQSEKATFADYNYLDGSIERIRAISQIAGTFNGAMRLKEQGHMDNNIVRNVALETVEKFKQDFLNIKGGYKKGIEKENFETFRYQVEYLVDDVNPNLRDNASRFFDSGELGKAYMTLFEGLRDVIESRGMSLSEAQAQYRSTDDGQVKAEMDKIINAYTLQGDILAILTMKGGHSVINAVYDNLVREANRRGYSLTDQYGRLISQEIDDMRMLAPGSTEVVKRMLRYHLKQNGGFKANVVMEALEGDVFMMNSKLANHLNKYVYTTKVPKGYKKILLTTQRLATKLIMSSIPRLADRFALFTAFDMNMGTLLNPKTVTKMPKAYRELSAFMQSKGAVIEGDLKEFLNVMGIDPTKSSYNILFNRGEQYEKEGTVLKGYFDIAGKSLSFQHLLTRYAMWLESKESLKKGKKHFGAAYHRKDLIKDIEARHDADGNELSSREGEQAGFLISQQLGAFNDFPMLAKSLNGWAMFTTFPLALVRWGVGETKSLHAASKAALFEGDTDAMKYLGVQGLGILGIYLMTNFLIRAVVEAMDLDEETEEEWIHRQAMPEFVKSIIQGQPVMNTFSSANPVRVLEDLTTGKVRDSWKESDGDLGYAVKEGVTQWALNNIASRGNPGIKTAAELLGGTDMIGGTFIDNSDRYNMWENFVRKMGAFFIGGAGANAMMRQYNQAKYDDDNSFGYHLMQGMRRALDAELGNTRTYKNNQRNYWRANNIIQGYRFKDHEEGSVAFSTNDFDYTGYSSLRAEMSRLMHDGARFSQIYNLIQEHMDEGLSLNEVRSAVRNNSVEYKLSRVDDFDTFWNSLTDSDKKVIKDAIAYERYMFPWLRDTDEEFTRALSSNNTNRFVRPIRTPRVNTRHTSPRNYNFNQNLFTGNRFRPPVTSRNPYETYRYGSDR